MMAGISILQDDVIDAEFETVSGSGKIAAASFHSSLPDISRGQTVDQLSLLRDQFADPRKTSHPDALSPTFLIVTLICAFVVFWVSGGRALLY